MVDIMKNNYELPSVEGIDVNLKTTENLLNEKYKFDLNDEEISELGEVIKHIDDKEIENLDIEGAKKGLEAYGVPEDVISEVEEYMVELKSNPNKLENDFENQIFPWRVIVPIVFGLLFLEGCDNADSHEKKMMQLYKEIKKKDLVYNGKITINGKKYVENKVIAQKLGKDIEIDIEFREWTLKGTLQGKGVAFLEKICIIYNEDTKKFIIKKDGKEREPSNEELEAELIMVEKRKDAIVGAIEKREDDDDNENFRRHNFKHNIKREARKKWKKWTRDS